MTESLPIDIGADGTSPELRTQTLGEVDASAITDLDIASILYITEIPEAHQSQNESLPEVTAHILDWRAWETTRVEEAVQQKVIEKKLPHDESVESKAKRTAYRVKLIEYLRGSSPWIVVTGTMNEQAELPEHDHPSDTPLNIVVAQYFLGLPVLGDHIQFRTLLKAICSGFSQNNGLVQPHHHTIVTLQYDDVSKAYRAIILTLSFTVQVSQPGRASPSAKVACTISHATFSSEQWKQAAPDSGQTEVGRAIVKQKSMDFLIDAQLA